MRLSDAALIVGVLIMGMALGALLTRIRLRAAVAQMVREELDRIDSTSESDSNRSTGDRSDAA